MRSVHGLVPNPAWATDIIATTMETMEASGIPPRWLPMLTEFQALSSTRVVADVKEYGCGAYGCVYPTHDPTVVLKLTGDETEAQFAADLAPLLERPICVRYYRVAEPVGAKDQRGAQVYLLWRESADHVGQIADVLHEQDGNGDIVYALIKAQHQAAQDAYQAITYGKPPAKIQRLVVTWLETCEAMARQTDVPELRDLGDGMVEIYRAQRILFGDIHSGNLGMVHRPEGDHWVITDPGHVAVINL